jgi:hypothetical protein
VCITAWLSEPQQLEVLHVPIDRAVMVAWQLEVLRIPLSSRLRQLMESSTFCASCESSALRTKLGIFRIFPQSPMEAAPKFVMTSEPDYGQLRPRLGWLPIDAIKKTFKHTTQLARMPMSTILKK